MRIAAFDPGGTTGVARIDDSHALEFPPRLDQLTAEEHHQEIWRMLQTWWPETVVCEDFLYRQQSNAHLKAVEYIGIIRLWCLQQKVPLFLQTAATGKAFWTDDKIKKIGLWSKGTPHSRDALRHLIHHLTFTEGNHYFIDLLK